MEQEEEIARVEGEIQILTHENTDYQERMTMLLSKMEEKKNEIEQLEFKIREYASNRKVRFSFFILCFIFPCNECFFIFKGEDDKSLVFASVLQIIICHCLEMTYSTDPT